MPTEGDILGNVINNNGLPAGPNFIAYCRFDFQLSAWLQPESNLVTHRAGDPAILGYPGDCGETHTGGSAHNLKDRGDCIYARSPAAT